MYYKVVLLDAIRDYDRAYIYFSRENLLEGQVVLVPFGQGNKPREGLVLGLGEAFSHAKTIVAATDIFLDSVALEAVKYLSSYYALPMASYIRLFLPKSMRVEPKRYLLPRPDLTGEELELYLSLESDEEILGSGLAEYHYSYDDRVSLAKKEMLFSLYGKKQLEDYLAGLPKSYLRQREIIEALLEAYPDMVAREDRKLASIKTLESKGVLGRIYLVQEEESGEESLEDIPPLSRDEKQIFMEVDRKAASLSHLKKNPSQDMKLYLHLAKSALDKGRRFLLIFPDNSMIPGAEEIFRRYFGKKLGVIHSRMSKKEEKQELLAYKEGRLSIMITNRMGLFLPLEQGDTLVIENCQDDGYISRNPYYHSLELASFYASFQGLKVLFASTIMPLEFYLRDEIVKYSLYRKRDLNTKLVDMRRELASGNTSPISRELREKISSLLSEKKMGLLLMNKLNYASYIFCRSCGHVLSCPNCGSSLHLDKKKGELFCPNCDYRGENLESCPQCNSRSFKFYGGGIDMIKEELENLFPQARIQTVDARTMETKDGYIRLHELLKEKKVDLVLGTSIIARGLDYEIDFLAVINADFYLHLPSYRASEKGYQLLRGFLERAKAGGESLIQTYQPKNYVLQGVLLAQDQDFYKRELKIRRERELPPFIDYILIRVLGEGPELESNAEKLRESLSGLGAHVSEVYGHWLPRERRILIKGQDLEEIKRRIGDLHTGNIQFSVEVDPRDSV